MSNRIALIGRLSIGFCLGLVLLCSSVEAQSSGNSRPFCGSASGAIVGQIPPNGLELSYQGRATHLGKFSREEVLYLNSDGSFVGQLVFHAANGDKLYANITGQFISASTAVGQYAFAGGTGRFSCARGSAEFQAETPDGINVRVEFSGSIQY